MKPLEPAEFGFDQARHLLWRAGFGGTPDQILTLASWGPGKSVDALLDFSDTESYSAPSAREFDGSIMRPPSERERRALQQARQEQNENEIARLRRIRQERQREDRRQVRDMQRWWLTRMIESPRPLEEKLTLFWHGHFATSYRTIENSYHMFQQNQLFRSHAAGNFGELLYAIIRDPAMLAYLDNNENIRGRPNENLARELMELFSLGEGEYSERDIREGARALTGYSFDGNGFAFYPNRHDPGQKSIFGKRGEFDGDDFVTAILSRRDCSEFMAQKLYRFFVAEVPGDRSKRGRAVANVIKQIASDLRENRYEIRPVLRRLLMSEHFYDPSNVMARIKSPAELVVGTIRSLGTPSRDLGTLLSAMDLMGQNLLFPPSVKGWDGERSWINTSTLYVRANVANYLVTGRSPAGMDPLADDRTYDPMGLLADLRFGAERDPEAVSDRLLRLALGASPSRERQWLIKDLFEQRGTIDAESVREALSLICAMPEYQLC